MNPIRQSLGLVIKAAAAAGALALAGCGSTTYYGGPSASVVHYPVSPWVSTGFYSPAWATGPTYTTTRTWTTSSSSGAVNSARGGSASWNNGSGSATGWRGGSASWNSGGGSATNWRGGSASWGGGSGSWSGARGSGSWSRR